MRFDNWLVSALFLLLCSCAENCSDEELLKVRDKWRQNEIKSKGLDSLEVQVSKNFAVQYDRLRGKEIEYVAAFTVSSDGDKQYTTVLFDRVKGGHVRTVLVIYEDAVIGYFDYNPESPPSSRIVPACELEGKPTE